MADTTALKNRIKAAIKANDNQEITGPVLQQALLDMVDELNGATETEASARQSGDNTLQQNLNTETQQRQSGDNTLQQNLNTETQQRQEADTQLNNLITGIKNNIDNGYVYAGIATPSTTPTSGKVFYLALTAGTYTNFGATVVPQGVNILKYNGSAWSLDSFLELDDAPTQGSNNLVKSSGVLDSIIKDGSAFDLSAYNSGATYADLSAALTALNALPAAYKKAGMSFKFVLSSDNKYVSYRLMATEFSTTESDWQSINADEEPTPNSRNLVESGGTAIAIDKEFAKLVIPYERTKVANNTTNMNYSFVSGRKYLIYAKANESSFINPKDVLYALRDGTSTFDVISNKTSSELNEGFYVEFTPEYNSAFYGRTYTSGCQLTVMVWDLRFNIENYIRQEDYSEIDVPTYNEQKCVSSCTVRWSDGTVGVYTSTDWDADELCYKGYEVTYGTSYKLTQSAVTFSEHLITHIPDKVITSL